MNETFLKTAQRVYERFYSTASKTFSDAMVAMKMVELVNRDKKSFKWTKKNGKKL